MRGAQRAALWFVVLVARCCTCAGEWVARPSMPTARRQLSVDMRTDSTLFAVGGSTPSLTSVNEVYTASTSTWEAMAPMPTVRKALVCRFVDDFLFAVGGCCPVASTGQLVEIFSPATSTWTTGPSMPTGRNNMAAAVSGNSKLYVIGGKTTSVVVGTLELYRTTTGQWSSLPSMPTARYGHGADTYGSELFVAGGVDGDSSIIDVLEKYSIPSSTWSTAPAMPTARMWLGTVTAGTTGAHTVPPARPLPACVLHLSCARGGPAFLVRSEKSVRY